MISLALSLALTSSGICNPLQKCNLELEARVGIEPNQRLYQKPCRHSKVPARTQDTNTTLLTLGKSQIFAFLSSPAINRLKLQNYSGTTLVKLRCWQFCWQSKTQKILSLPEILPLVIAVTNALSCFTSPADGRPCLPSRPRRFRSAKSALVTSGICISRMIGVLPPASRRRSLRLRSRRLSACAPLSRSPNRRPKQTGAKSDKVFPSVHIYIKNLGV